MGRAGGSLRGRLVLAFVAVAILCAVLIGVITLSLIRLAPERGLEQQLADQAQAVSEVVAGRRPVARLCALGRVLRRGETEVYLLDQAAGTRPVPCQGVNRRTPIAPAPDADLAPALAPVQQEVAALLRQGAACEQAKTANTCRKLRTVEAALWTSARLPGLEPTNNAAERAIRPAVLWRKRSGGTQTAAGSRFVERLLTTVTTLRQQRRDVLAYLTEACAAAHHGRPAPSLLPATAAAPSAGATN